MIVDSANASRFTIKTVHGATDVLVNAAPVRNSDQRLAILGAENDVVVQAMICRTHAAPPMAALLRPLPGSSFICASFPVVSGLRPSTTGYRS